MRKIRLGMTSARVSRFPHRALLAPDRSEGGLLFTFHTPRIHFR